MRRAPIATAVIVALCGLSCVVTDELEFELAINQPVEIVATAPSSDAVHLLAQGAALELSVVVRDPDVLGLASPALEGQIALSMEPFSPDFDDPANRNRSCDQPQLLDPRSDDELLGSRYEIRCTADFGDAAVLRLLNPGDLVLVRVLISDLGFVSGAVPEQATTAAARFSLYVVEAPP